MDDLKACTTCKEIKTLSEFSPRKNRPSGRHYSCKVCLAERAKIQRKSKPSSSAQKEVARLRSAIWRKENPERNAEMKSGWRLLNLHTKNAANKRRDLEKLKRTPSWLSKEHEKLILDFYWLAKDLKSVTGEEYHVDHIVPLQGNTVCGLHVPWNLQVLPKDLNLSKGNRLDYGI